jgi:hypothetical protein
MALAEVVIGTEVSEISLVFMKHWGFNSTGNSVHASGGIALALDCFGQYWITTHRVCPKRINLCTASFRRMPSSA